MQFDVHLNLRDDDGDAPYLIELQSDGADLLAVRIVAPLMTKSSFKRMSRFQPEVTIKGKALLLVVHEVFAIDTRELGPFVVNLSAERDRIIAALDFLFTGV